jgi:hypothetical protein
MSEKFFVSRADYEKFLSYLTDALHKYGVIVQKKGERRI